MLEIKNVSKKFIVNKKDVEVLNDVNITFPDTGLYVLSGKSGCGKSTLLNLIAGYDKPTKGNIFYNNIDICNISYDELSSYQRNEIGFVFQSYNLFDNLTVNENLMFSKDIITNEEVKNVLDKLEIGHLINRKVSQISGGEKARVALARGLIRNPKILLCDEPTGNLDSKTSKEVFNILKKISDSTLVIVVSHDLDLASKYADTILPLKNKEINYIIPTQKHNITLKKNNSKINFKLFYKKNIFSNILITFILFLLYSFCIIGINFLQNNIRKTSSYIPKDNNTYLTLSKNINTINTVLFRYNKSEISDVTSYLDNKNIKYNVINTYNYLRLKSDPALNFEEGSAYGMLKNLNVEKIIQKNKNTMDKKYIGNFPENANEIMISNLYAKMIMYGVMQNGKIFKPLSYEDIIGTTLIYDASPYSDVKLKITGIYNLDYDLQKFDSIKLESYTDENGAIGIKPNKLYTYFLSNYNTIYVNDNFFDILDVKPCNAMDEYTYEFFIKSNKEYKLLNFNSNAYYNDSLNDNEIVVNKYILDLLTNKDYSNKLYSSGENEYTFAINYLKENNLLNNFVEVKIKDLYGIYGIKEKMNDFTLKIVDYIPSYQKDYAITNDYFYVSKNVLNDYLENQREVNYIEVIEKNPNKIYKLDKYFENNGYILNTKYSHDVEKVSIIISKASPYIWLVTIILILFIILFTTFVFIFKLHLDKKNIGILKSLGYKNNEIKGLYKKLFKCTFLPSLIISIFLSIPTNIILNNILSNYFKFKLRLIFNNALTYFIVLIIYIITYVLSLKIPINRVAKINVSQILREKDE